MRPFTARRTPVAGWAAAERGLERPLPGALLPKIVFQALEEPIDTNGPPVYQTARRTFDGRGGPARACLAAVRVAGAE